MNLLEGINASIEYIENNLGSEIEYAEKPPVGDFVPFVGKVRKPGTGCVTMINDHLYEGRFTPTNADGKRISKNIYAPTREECEEKLAVLIARMKAEIAEEKAKRKSGQESA